MIIIVSCIVLIFYYSATKQNLEEIYSESARSSAVSVAELSDVIDLRKFFGMKEIDDEYLHLLAKLENIRKKSNLLYIYYSIPFEEDGEKGVEHILVASEAEPIEGRHQRVFLDDEIHQDSINTFNAMMQTIEGESSSEIVFLSNENGNVLSAFAPVTFEGEIIAVAGVDISMTTINKTVVHDTFLIAGIIIVFFILFSLIFIAIIRKKIVKPINSLANEMSNFIVDSSDGMISNFDKSDITGSGEVGTLIEDFNIMKGDIKKYTENIASISAERERMNTELDLAAKIQRSNLKTDFPAFSNEKAFNLFAATKEAKEIGGDFYDYFMIDENHLLVLIADVEGKGIPAALLMMKTNTIIENIAYVEKNPVAIMNCVNKKLLNSNDEGLYVTVFLGILNTANGKMVYTNAGHTSPIFINNDSCILLKNNHDLMAGAMEDAQYHSEEIEFTKGGRLFLYTDGVTEGFNTAKEPFGEERLLKAILKNKEKRPEDLIQALSEELNSFTGDAEQSDDITMLVLDYN